MSRNKGNKKASASTSAPAPPTKFTPRDSHNGLTSGTDSSTLLLLDGEKEIRTAQHGLKRAEGTPEGHTE
ncbi:hypothetical protein BDD12DRAFT_883274 [Trichophaea hybrida]|nr:hypothetical protein BDD12DRAFT_883274 [Trichophaea hybrida]